MLNQLRKINQLENKNRILYKWKWKNKSYKNGEEIKC
jgi:hypothetical protein